MPKALKAAIVGVSCAVGVFGPGPSPYVRSALQFHDFLHVPAFAGIAAVLLVGATGRHASTRERVRQFVVVLAVSVLVGILIELLQGATGNGDMDAWDVVRDIAGTVAALLVAASFWPEIGALRRWTLRLLALLTLVGFLVPTLAAVSDERQARRDFPVLANFTSAAQLERFQWSRLAIVQRVCSGQEGQACYARISLAPGRYPGVTLRYFPRDWRGYHRFVISCTNPSAEPLTLQLRIDDRRHNNRYGDRFNASYVLATGRNEIRVPLADVEHAPHGRTLDLAHVRNVTVFAYKLGQQREFLLENIRLE